MVAGLPKMVLNSRHLSRIGPTLYGPQPALPFRSDAGNVFRRVTRPPTKGRVWLRAEGRQKNPSTSRQGFAPLHFPTSGSEDFSPAAVSLQLQATDQALPPILAIKGVARQIAAV
jgi:hypothetical protein